MAGKIPPEEAKIIVQAFLSGMTIDQIKAKFGRGKASVRTAMHDAGYPFLRRLISQEEGDRMASRYVSGLSLSQVAAEFGTSRTPVSKAVNDRMLMRNASQANRIHALDEDFFSRPPNEEAAYWLGFLSADGNVRDRPYYQIALTLQRRDRPHLEKYKASLKTEAPIRDFTVENTDRPTQVASSLDLTSKKMVSDLISLGVTERKSLTIQPWTGPEPLMRHYWRGVIDGDGCIHRSPSGDRWDLTLVGSRFMVDGFLNFARAVYPTKAKPHRVTSVFAITFCGKGVVGEIARALYQGSTVHLDRKKVLADEASTVVPKFYRCRLREAQARTIVPTLKQE